jgi:hypothetical protein
VGEIATKDESSGLRGRYFFLAAAAQSIQTRKFSHPSYRGTSVYRASVRDRFLTAAIAFSQDTG